MQVEHISVWMITYNHEDFIEKAIKSVLSQQTNFSLKLYIGEDLSSDQTHSICLRLATKYPDSIVLLPSDQHYGLIDNIVRTLKECRGKYVALLEGDDYWTDNKKLQKQVDFLEHNPDYAVCCHDVFHRRNNKNYRSGGKAPRDSDLTYLLRKGNYITTASVVYRNDPLIASFVQKFSEAPLGDYFMHISAARNGKIRFMKEPMAVYRIHSGGVWSKLSFEESFLKTIAVIEMLFDYFNEKRYQDDLKIQLLAILDELFWIKEFRGLAEHPLVKNIMTKMGIPEFIPEYLKFSVIERSGSFYFSQNVPVPVLAKALKQRLTNKIFGN